MTIHVVIPVFNRLAMTQALVACLRKQGLTEALRILVVDDGSSDGTAEWLGMQKDIDVLNGDGALFWGGAVALALRHLKSSVPGEDWVLLMNNDTVVKENFVQCLLDTALANAPAAVGSIVCDEADHTRLLDTGAVIDAWRFRIPSPLKTMEERPPPGTLLDVDVLSGRGTLYPLAGLIASGGMRPRFLPHYLSDYEISLRVRKKGWRLLVSTDAMVYSCEDFASRRPALSWRDKYFSIHSTRYLPARVAFWWEASSWLQRLTMPLNYLRLLIIKNLLPFIRRLIRRHLLPFIRRLIRRLIRRHLLPFIRRYIFRGARKCFPGWAMKYVPGRVRKIVSRILYG